MIVVTWNARPYLEELVRGLCIVDYPRDAFTVHIVDNASSDESADYVKSVLANPPADLPKVVLHEPGSNTGFAGGNNLVMRTSHADYCYLLNHDAAFEPGTLREAVAVAETHPNAGSVQSLLVLMQDPKTINSTGNDIHFAAFGYCRGYKLPVADAPMDVMPIAYASGAGVLYRNSVLRKVGLLDETLFAYHEDLDLGWRMMISGYDNLLAPKSILRHRYEFSRSVKKWYWMERNRWAVYLMDYRLGTILLTLPAMAAVEIATWIFSIKGGWVKEKGCATAWFFKPSTWVYLASTRRATQRLRRRSDREILKRFVSSIAYQDVESPFMLKVANPLMAVYFAILKLLVVW
ncbi:MAG TPA: glycosyltransferase family 2 protein [Candidatus Methylomirabilis sp.]|nr:glycosyltransferase family 2 protein [Candidatus Methylomirabilis sp.]